jgi:hypothetical protein
MVVVRANRPLGFFRSKSAKGDYALVGQSGDGRVRGCVLRPLTKRVGAQFLPRPVDFLQFLHDRSE